MHQGCDTVVEPNERPSFGKLKMESEGAHGAEGIERFIVLCLVGGVLVLTSYIATWLNMGEQVATLPAVIGAVLLSTPLFFDAFKEVKSGRLSASTLAAIGIAAALANQEYQTAGFLAFILLVAGQAVNRSAFGARRAIQQLVNLTPDKARVVHEDHTHEMLASEVKVGQIVRVLAGENLPVDGQIKSGQSTINQASLTGEAVPVSVQAGDRVYAGTTNLSGQIDLEVTEVGEDTTIGKVSQLISEAEGSKSPRQALIEQVAQFFVPVALSLAGIVWFITSRSSDPAIKAEAAQRAITVLIVACPAALLLASPSAMVAAFASAARLGILVKRTEFLEASANLDAVVMDKTGTITTGRFEVSRLVPAEGVTPADLLTSAAFAEQHSTHPLAQSIMDTSRKANIAVGETDHTEEVHGRGVRASVAGEEILAGRPTWLAEVHPQLASEINAVEAKVEGMSGVHVSRGGRYFGVVALEDKVKPTTKGVVARLRELGVRSVAIFTGDRLSVAKRVGTAVGVDTVEAECLPEEKHQQIQQMVSQGYRTMMVGDGINDGPSLAAADVGVAMGLSGSDIATNSAGVALMTDDLNRVPFLIELARKSRLIVAQNIAASILIVIVGLILASSGLLAVPAAGLYHFAGEVFVLANSFRLFRFGEDFADADAMQQETQQVLQRRAASLRNLQAAGA
ncbi:MAG: heavy metal translocating P-type ATPase [Planctomycetota bacterium]